MLDLLNKEKFIAIFRGINEENIARAARAAYDGGVRIFEITFDPMCKNTEYTTAKAISDVYNELGGDIAVCAGTCIKPEYVDAAKSAGAKAIISPGTSKKVIERTKELSLISIPGAFTPTEILSAYEAGADIVKIFPILPDNIKYLRTILPPIPHIPFIPTGGVNPQTAGEFLSLGALAVAAGATIVTADAVRKGDFEGITKRAREHTDAVKRYLEGQK